MFEKGFDWYNSKTNETIHTPVRAPITSVDVPARANVL